MLEKDLEKYPDFSLIREIYDRVKADMKGWNGIPYEAVCLYIANCVFNPKDVKYFMARHIPPDKAGDIVLGFTTE